ncbi:RNA-binding S4 domain-containing protein [Skermanella mucosa]|uniref:RNA-binding S4 domain-containing protein n=1 Tax=Skermanella mucosa TaxID=1789672 RepID=UPI00192AC848|nr:RNA-binding S4 domain-containing protein [Skermanella mucosa]UEM20351.1 RNA-binding S4 domain-containing protein [Skermanella mucosa]
MTTEEDRDDDQGDGGAATAQELASGRLRLDKWLWYARFFKTRSLAAKLCAAGAVRIGGAPVTKAHHAVKPGDVLTFAQGRHIRIIKVMALGTRRGPAPEAQALYEDLSPPAPETAMARPAERPPGAGRPTKAERRATERLRSDS